jgi:hypothetical protein
MSPENFFSISSRRKFTGIKPLKESTTKITFQTNLMKSEKTVFNLTPSSVVFLLICGHYMVYGINYNYKNKGIRVFIIRSDHEKQARFP